METSCPSPNTTKYGEYGYPLAQRRPFDKADAGLLNLCYLEDRVGFHFRKAKVAWKTRETAQAQMELANGLVSALEQKCADEEKAYQDAKRAVRAHVEEKQALASELNKQKEDAASKELAYKKANNVYSNSRRLAKAHKQKFYKAVEEYRHTSKPPYQVCTTLPNHIPPYPTIFVP